MTKLQAFRQTAVIKLVNSRVSLRSIPNIVTKRARHSPTCVTLFLLTVVAVVANTSTSVERMPLNIIHWSRHKKNKNSFKHYEGKFNHKTTAKQHPNPDPCTCAERHRVQPYATSRYSSLPLGSNTGLPPLPSTISRPR
jgi:ABC-type nickel/cobalt efflux system permease component RcnA